MISTFDEAVDLISHKYTDVQSREGGVVVPSARGWLFLYSRRTTLSPESRLYLLGINPTPAFVKNAPNHIVPSCEDRNPLFGSSSPYAVVVTEIFEAIRAELNLDHVTLESTSVFSNFVPYVSGMFSQLRVAPDLSVTTGVYDFGVNLWAHIFRSLAKEKTSTPQRKVLLFFKDEPSRVEQIFRKAGYHVARKGACFEQLEGTKFCIVSAKQPMGASSVDALVLPHPRTLMDKAPDIRQRYIEACATWASHQLRTVGIPGSTA